MVLLALVAAEVYLEENFDKTWEKRWIKSSRIEQGKIGGRFRVSAGNYVVNRRLQRGLQTADDGRQYLISSRFRKCFNTSGRDFIVQFNLKLEGKIDKGQAYLKFYNDSFKPEQFYHKQPYHILFGPDFWGWDRHHIDFRVMRNRTEYKTSEHLTCFEDRLSHSYRLTIRGNQTYQVMKDGFIDMESDLETAFGYTQPREIFDHTDVKPADWEDEPYIDDPDDVYDAERNVRVIPDPTSIRPADWDDARHGKWQPRMMLNPDYREDWKPSRIPNPAFRGEWQPRKVANPEYVPDAYFAKPQRLCWVGIDVEQDVAGSIWSHILITDDEAYADQKLEEWFDPIREPERALYKQFEDDKKKGEKKARPVEYGERKGENTEDPL